MRLWVTRTVVRLRCLRRLASIAKIISPVRSSRFPVGSSASSRDGFPASARAMATRCISPPDNSPARWWPRARRPTSSSADWASCRALFRGNAANQQRHHDVFERGEFRHEVMLLPHIADLSVPKRRKVRLRKAKLYSYFCSISPLGTVCRGPRAGAGECFSPRRSHRSQLPGRPILS